MGSTDTATDGADTATFSPHKFYGLCGCGVLVRRRNVMLEPQQLGGMADTPFRSGTPAVAMIEAASTALSLALDELPARLSRVRALNRFLRQGGAEKVAAAQHAPRRQPVYPERFGLRRADALQRRLAEQGICVSTKSACCAPGTPSRPVFALTHDRKAALSTLRVSLSHRTTEQELSALLDALEAGLSEEGGPAEPGKSR